MSEIEYQLRRIQMSRLKPTQEQSKDIYISKQSDNKERFIQAVKNNLTIYLPYLKVDDDKLLENIKHIGCSLGLSFDLIDIKELILELKQIVKDDEL